MGDGEPAAGDRARTGDDADPASSRGQQQQGARDDDDRADHDTTTTRLPELELALDAAARVNRHLNGELEGVLVSLRQADEERSAWEERATWLARRLADERRARQNGRQRQPGDDEEEKEDDQEAAAKQLVREAALAAAAAQEQQPGNNQQQQLLAREAWQACAAERRALERAGRAGGWLARRADIELRGQLGQGAFGVTYRCTWRGADAVAKHLRPPQTAAEALNFLREVQCLASVRHPHVVPFLGAVLSEGPEELWLLSEVMPGGNMADWLRGRKASAVVGATAGAASSSSSRPPPLAERVAAALDVARALAALAGARPLPIMHRDVKPSNVFIDAGGRARLGDFGLARPYCSDGVEDDDKEEEGDKTTTTTAAASAFRAAAMTDLTGETGTYAYMAPEVIRHEAYDGAKADAWAFGIFLVECCTLERPYEAERLLPVQIALAVADEKLKPWIPAQLLPPSVAVLAAALCDFDPAMRPDWAFVIGELEQTVGELRGERPARGGGDGTAGEAPSSSWLLSRLLSSELVPSSWIPVLGAAASAVTADGGGGGTGGGGGGGGGAGAGAGGAVGAAASS